MNNSDNLTLLMYFQLRNFQESILVENIFYDPTTFSPTPVNGNYMCKTLKNVQINVPPTKQYMR